MSKVRLPDGFVDELKARLRPSDVIGRKVKLQRRGKEWVGLSPFTNEKTPSFYVNDAKGIFKDFSSGLGGDVITFLQETERLSFMEAVERLAEEAGMALPTASPEEEARYDRLARLKAVCAAAAGFFQEKLHSPAGADAREYLEVRRGLAPQDWARWSIGHAPDDWRQLFTHLKQAGFSEDEILSAGLAKRSDKGGEPYDVFRNRIIFPIEDTRGDVIAFGGRALDPEEKAKYLNSPETDLFHKSSILYNYRRARAGLGHGEDGGLIVCEGYMDVIALAEAGFAQAVAPLGTALTERQLDLLWKAGPQPVLCLDGDAAGLRAAYRAIDLALPHVQPGRSVNFCLLPDGLDPDDLVRQPGGTARMAELLERPRPLVDMVWQRELAAEPLTTPEQKAGLEARLMAGADSVAHPAVRAAYRRDLMARLREHLWQARRSGGQAAPGPRGALRASTRTKGLGLILRAIACPDLIDHHGEALASAEFPDPAVTAIRDAMFDLLLQKGEVDRLAVRDHLTTAGYTRAAQLLDSYPDLPVLTPGTPAAREWLVALEQFAAPDEPVPAGGAGRDDPTGSALEWRRLHRRTAERRARLARLSEAASDTGPD